MLQQSNADLELAGVRAEAALQAGIQYAAAHLLAGRSCNTMSNPLTLPHNFRVTLQGCGLVAVANQPPVTVFSIQVTAAHGQYGTPDFVSRQRIVRIL